MKQDRPLNYASPLQHSQPTDQPAKRVDRNRKPHLRPRCPPGPKMLIWLWEPCVGESEFRKIICEDVRGTQHHQVCLLPDFPRSLACKGPIVTILYQTSVAVPAQTNFPASIPLTKPPFSEEIDIFFLVKDCAKYQHSFFLPFASTV